jgi:hypothetical protein
MMGGAGSGALDFRVSFMSAAIGCGCWPEERGAAAA